MASVVVNEFVASAPDDTPALFSLTRDFRFTGENGRLVHRVLPAASKGFKTISVTTSGHQASHLENDRLALTLPVSGFAEVELGGRVSHVKPGDAFLISPSERYSRLHPEPGSNYASFTVIAPPALSETMAPESCRLVEGWRGSAAAHQLFQLAFTLAHNSAQVSPRVLSALETLVEEILFDVLDATASPSAACTDAWGDEIVRRALPYLHGHLHLPISMVDVARGIDVGLRAMQVAFRERLGQTPKQVLARMRLESMRQRLVRPTMETTVTSAALDAGLFHLGRASCAYHDCFGELPSTTLQRARSYHRQSADRT